MSKNIVVLSDGTGQEGGEGRNTNIYKIFNMVEDRTKRQITFYDRGLGTGWRKFSGNVAGAGISKNIKECYQFIFENFEADDQVYLFGFSRGAATVRSLSGFIHEFGVIPKSRPELIDKAWKIYKTGDEEKRKIKTELFLGEHHNMWLRIKFLGVFDTVAALGVPNKTISRIMDKIPSMRHKFHNLDLSASVENAYQALAIDDERKTFHPLIWNETKETYQTMKQVWFAGVHTDIGGGYKETELSDISLQWMLNKAVSKGLHIYPKHTEQLNPDVTGKMHDPFEGIKGNIWRRERRSWDVKMQSVPTVHESVLIRRDFGKNQEGPAYEPWILDIEHEVEPWPEHQRSESHLM
jgi:uncharacterized protein (DUF2235 family)